MKNRKFLRSPEFGINNFRVFNDVGYESNYNYYI